MCLMAQRLSICRLNIGYAEARSSPDPWLWSWLSICCRWTIPILPTCCHRRPKRNDAAGDETAADNAVVDDATTGNAIIDGATNDSVKVQSKEQGIDVSTLLAESMEPVR